MALYGVDVSHWNGIINFEKFQNAEKNNDFMMIKATQGYGYEDPRAAYNLMQCRERAILRGLYHYVTSDDWERQASNFCEFYHEHADKYTILALDVEDSDLLSFTPRQLGDFIYCLAADVYFRTESFPLIYVSRAFSSKDTFRDIGKYCGGWIASWNTGKGKPKRCDLNTTMWQYSDSGYVDGIKGYVDLNKAFLTAESWRKIANPGV